MKTQRILDRLESLWLSPTNPDSPILDFGNYGEYWLVTGEPLAGGKIIGIMSNQQDCFEVVRSVIVVDSAEKCVIFFELE